MDETLKELAAKVRDTEYKELFPDTDVEDARNDEEKVKEALFQVHYMLYNKDLYNKVTGENSPRNSDYRISEEEIADCLNEEEYVRFKKQLQGATILEEDGKTMIPKTDVQDILSARKGLMD